MLTAIHYYVNERRRACQTTLDARAKVFVTDGRTMCQWLMCLCSGLVWPGLGWGYMCSVVCARWAGEKERGGLWGINSRSNRGSQQHHTIPQTIHHSPLASGIAIAELTEHQASGNGVTAVTATTIHQCYFKSLYMCRRYVFESYDASEAMPTPQNPVSVLYFALSMGLYGGVCRRAAPYPLYTPTYRYVIE